MQLRLPGSKSAQPKPDVAETVATTTNPEVRDSKPGSMPKKTLVLWDKEETDPNTGVMEAGVSTIEAAQVVWGKMGRRLIIVG